MHPKIVEAAGNFHDAIRVPFGGQSQDIFDNSAPFDASKDMFDNDTDTGNETIQERGCSAALLPLLFFCGCWVKTPGGSYPWKPVSLSRVAPRG